MDRRQGPLRLPLPDLQGPDHPADGPGQRRRAHRGLLDRRARAGRGGPARRARGWRRRAARRPAHRRGRLRLRQVRARRAGTNDVDSRARAHSAEELDFLAAHVAGHGPERLLRPARGGARRAVRGARARGGGADRLPAPAQGRAEAPAEGLPPRPVDHPRRAADGGRARLVRARRPRRADPRRARSRGGGADGAGRGRSARRRGLDGRWRDPRRGARRRGAGPVHRRRPARRAHRGRRRLGAAACGRARRGGRRRAAHAAARRSLGDRRRRPRGGRAGLGAPGRRAADHPGPSTSAMLGAAAAGELAGLVVGGVDPLDLPDPAVALEALRRTSVSW